MPITTTSTRPAVSSRGALRRALDVVYGACGVLSAICLALIAAVTLASVAARMLGLVVPSASAIGGYLMAATTFLALAPTLRSGGHIRVELLVSRLNERARRWVELWCLAAAALLVGYLAYAGCIQVMNAYRFGTTAPGLLAIPIWIPQSAMALGLVVMTLAVVDLLIGALLGHTPRYEAARSSTDNSEPGL